MNKKPSHIHSSDSSCYSDDEIPLSNLKHPKYLAKDTPPAKVVAPSARIIRKKKQTKDLKTPTRSSPRKKASRKIRASTAKARYMKTKSKSSSGKRKQQQITSLKNKLDYAKSSKSKSSLGKRKQQNILSPKNKHTNVALTPGDLADRQLLIESPVLLTGAIYDLGIPDHFEGHLFRYVVSGYSTKTKKFELTYDAQTVKEDGTSFHIDEHSPTDILEDVAFETVQTGLDLFQNALNQINSHTKKHQDVVRKSLLPSPDECVTPDEVDLSDINEFVKTNTRGWLSEDVMKASIYVLPS